MRRLAVVVAATTVFEVSYLQTSSASPAKTVGPLETLSFDIGQYRIQAPASFSPWSRKPNVSHRSPHLVMTIPIEFASSPAESQAGVLSTIVVNLQLEPGNASRLEGYMKGITKVAVQKYDSYLRYALGPHYYLYIAPLGRMPDYVFCTQPLGAPSPLGPQLCTVDQSIAFGREGHPDLTMRFTFSEERWPELSRLTAAIESVIAPLVSVK